MLANLHFSYYCKSENILTVAFMYEKNVKRIDFNNILKPILNDIELSESEGINIKEKIFSESVICVTGDNLGSHEIGGFQENCNLSSFFSNLLWI